MGDEPVPLSYTEWKLVELDGEPLELVGQERRPTLVLDLEESYVSGSGGVNRLMGTFALSESELRFGPLATTLMAGPEDAVARERAFLDALARVTSFERTDRTLTLLAGNTAVARLVC
ncbi:MAG TPA: META domain-containing protein [Gaiellaceae bacterium]|nr:META domain-containing protein [Gaiellaceae bacterium]